MRIRSTSLSVIAVLLTAVTLACSSGPAYQLKKLPSGKEVKVLGMGQMNFPSGPPALMLKYQTDLPMNDVAALQAEANEIMEVLKVDAENARLTQAVISANELPKGLILKTGSSHNFLYERKADGTWAPK